MKIIESNFPGTIHRVSVTVNGHKHYYMRNAEDPDNVLWMNAGNLFRPINLPKGSAIYDGLEKEFQNKRLGERDGQ